MSFAMTDAQVRDHMRDVKRQMAQSRGRSPRAAQVHDAPGWPATRHPSRHLPHLTRLRSQVGFRLIEAGLHLLTDGQ